MKQNWHISVSDPTAVQKLTQELQIPPAIARVLLNRGLSDKAAIEKFFSPSTQDTHDPFLMADMTKAVERLGQAMLRREKVLVFGDYDVDGTTATSLLCLAFREIGLDTAFYIPDREREGYGLSRLGIDYAMEIGATLIITCDCGISAFDTIDYASSNKIDVVVTDHHEPGEKLPAAQAILDPKREDDNYPFKELCGAGVAFKLLQGFHIANNLPIANLFRHLDLVAIGTAADIVPILGENRILVARGLEYLNSSQKVGLQALLKTSGFDNKTMNVVNIVFGLAPRLNAAGRLGEASRAVHLLTSFNRDEALELANLLEQENRNRQSIERETIDSAILQLNATHDLDADKILILSNTNWHHGVIGIVASKLKELYNRPVVMISFQNGIGKGSARSIPGFDLYNAFNTCADLLENFGGHKMAAGLTILIESLPEFTRRLKKIANEQINEQMLNLGLHIDSEIDFKDINQQTLSFLHKMAPYGPGNMRPVFFSRNVNISGMPRIIGENHLKFKAAQNRSVLSAIGWKMGCYYEMLISNRPLDLAFVIDENEWNGYKEIQLNIKDIVYSN
ncbi:MAG: single-stranded-DNA-specific exonuclease RecJ [Candidatus Marinimicrobia bacterium]|nr:single-stranded-DNA-specific exonuclease RecJ [Candidatus Neomarinimicrobiota bacterium]MDD5062113.1 single-stranded-DNA-specific exonuclease RecJ [Candidatus Neomarinimicrobiota bacterium]MDD5230333.1 single-stranded-DNA-specific exonuclease RecJ [Candidatus Neomarinimicrobiota bacterium]